MGVVGEDHIVALLFRDGRDVFFPVSAGQNNMRLDKSLAEEATHHASGKRWDAPSW